MGWSGRWTRRGMVGLALGALAQRFVPAARAQTAGCEIGFVNGLLTVGGNDCDLFSPPGLGDTQVNAPSHLAGEIVDDTTADTSSTSDVLTAEERRLRRRDHNQQKKDNNQDHKQDKRNRKQNHLDDVRDRRITCDDFNTRKEAEDWVAQFPEDAKFLDPEGDGKICEHMLITCDDFNDQKEAIEWLAEHSEDAGEIDADTDGLACEELDVVRCSDFNSKADVQAWLNVYLPGYYPNPGGKDPYNLFRGDPEELCPGLDEE